MSEQLRVALLGTGTTLTRLVQALAVAGHRVTVAASAPVKAGSAALADGAPAGGALRAASIEESVADADVVLTLNPPVASLKVARQVAALLPSGAVYADFNPGSPAMKRRLAELFPEHDFAEGTLTEAAELGPDASGLAAAVSGPGAPAVAELLKTAGVAVETISTVTGDAAARQILRSVLDKALAAAVIDVLWAAESLGQKDWAYQQVLATFAAGSADTAAGYLSGTAQHLKRRQMEMMDVVETMRETGYDSTLVAAIETNYSRILHGKRIPFSKLK